MRIGLVYRVQLRSAFHTKSTVPFWTFIYTHRNWVNQNNIIESIAIIESISAHISYFSFRRDLRAWRIQSKVNTWFKQYDTFIVWTHMTTAVDRNFLRDDTVSNGVGIWWGHSSYCSSSKLHLTRNQERHDMESQLVFGVRWFIAACAGADVFGCILWLVAVLNNRIHWLHPVVHFGWASLSR